MIRDAASGAYKHIIVYMFDRFARNRRDSVMYKEMLREKYGVKVLLALEDNLFFIGALENVHMQI